MKNFSEIALPTPLANALNAMGFDTPTPIQAQAIPLALSGVDILGSAATGTGKTGAFGVPLVAHLLNNPESMALVLTPTRELAGQVAKVINQLLGKQSSIKSALLIGGESMFKQLQALKARPRVIIGTPGRVNDHLKRRSLRLDQADMLVLDETDRMLDMGFGIQIDAILEFMPSERQTLMFSATLPKAIVAMSQRYMYEPQRISVGEAHVPTENVEQELVRVTEPAKYGELLTQLEKRDGSIIVFVKTKYGAEKLAKKLMAEQHNASAIHGDLRQHKREKVINAFRNRRHRILVATDVAARGLDIPHIEHVINYDLPQCPEDYIHRIGRTARGGARGQAISLLAPSDNKKWSAIYRMLNPKEAAQPRTGQNDSHRKPQKKRPFGAKRRDAAGHPGFGDERKPATARPAGKKKPFGNKNGSKPFGQRDGSSKFEGKSFDGKRKPGGQRDGDSKFEGKSFEGKRKPGGQRDGGSRFESKSFEGKRKPSGQRGGKPNQRPRRAA